MAITSTVSDNTDNLSELHYRICDVLLATVLCVCFFVGFPGNILSLRYFLSKPGRSLSDNLYIASCCIDSVTSIVHLPAAAVLFNQRNPGIMDNPTFCSFWYLTFLFLQQMSMFLVLLMSASRTLAIMYPFLRINKRAVILSIPVYAMYIILSYVVIHFSAFTRYIKSNILCFVGPIDDSLSFPFEINYSICIGVPPILIAVAFILTIMKLRKEQNNVQSASKKKMIQASVTISYFTAVFLACNLITFASSLLYLVTVEILNDRNLYYTNEFMSFYWWFLSSLFCMVLNAALNPILYFWRMKELRLFILTLTHQ